MKHQTYTTNAEYIEAMMKRFKLVDMRKQYRDLILEAEESSLDYESFLVRLLAIEEKGKRGRRTEKLKKEACFELEKRLEDIDYGFNRSLDRDKITELGRLDFIDACENVMIIGAVSEGVRTYGKKNDVGIFSEIPCVRGFRGRPLGEGVAEDRKAGWSEGETSPSSLLKQLLQIISNLFFESCSFFA